MANPYDYLEQEIIELEIYEYISSLLTIDGINSWIVGGPHGPYLKVGESDEYLVAQIGVERETIRLGLKPGKLDGVLVVYSLFDEDCFEQLVQRIKEE